MEQCCSQVKGGETNKLVAEKLGYKVGNEKHKRKQKQANGHCSHCTSDKETAPVPGVSFLPGGHLCLVPGLITKPLVPPGALAIQVSADLRCSYRSHLAGEYPGLVCQEASKHVSFHFSRRLSRCRRLASRCSWRRLMVMSPRVRSLIERTISVRRRNPPVMASG